MGEWKFEFDRSYNGERGFGIVVSTDHVAVLFWRWSIGWGRS